MRTLRRLLPWLIAASLLVYLFRQYPAEDILAAVGHARLPLLVTFLLFYFTYLTLADSFSLWKTLRHFDIDSRYSEILMLRLASNLPMVLNYGVGQGFLAYLIGRKLATSVSLASGILLLLLATDLYWAITIAAIGALFADTVVDGHDLGRWIHTGWLLISTMIVVFFLVKPRLTRLPTVPGALSGVLSVFRQISPGGYLGLMLGRLPLHAAAATYLYFLAMCFGVEVPFATVLAFLPVTVAIGALPIAPSGLGTVQFAAVLLFGHLVSGGPVDAGAVSGAEMIFAMSLLFTVSLYLLKLVSGLLAIRSAVAS